MIDVFKVGFTVLPLLLVWRFLKLFHKPESALVLSFAFIFYPSHDSIPFWYAPTGHLLAFGLYLEAYTQVVQSRRCAAFVLASLASFLVYASTPIAFGLAFLAVLSRKVVDAAVLLVPNLVYIGYFGYLSIVARATPSRLLEPLGPLSFAKNFCLQMVTFVDATIGPSFWYKVVYSIAELGVLSACIGLVVGWLCMSRVELSNAGYDTRLVLCLGTITILTFAIFSLTGRYPQLAFNLGNRTTFWGSFLLVYLVMQSGLSRRLRAGFLCVVLLASLGISDHWRSWNNHQQRVLLRIKCNQQLQRLPSSSLLLVSGNQYSKLGPFSHVEFLSEEWVTRDVFRLLEMPSVRVIPINKNYQVRGNRLVSAKSFDRELSETVTIYDSTRDRVVVMKASGLNRYIQSLPKERRHWIQLEESYVAAAARRAAVYFMPRLRGRL